MEVYFSTDVSDGITEIIQTPRASVSTTIRVVAGENGAIGSLTTSMNGQWPCGTVSYCEMPPTPQPTTSPSSQPTTSPSYSPTNSPDTSMPTFSPTDKPSPAPITSSPSKRPTTSPTSGPTTSPTNTP